jgi:metal-responsive CopG/Arc/MetJ family transcriptional regulator
MIRTQIYLTEEEHLAIGQIASRSGQGRSEVIRKAIDDFVIRQGRGSRLRRLRAGRGVWAKRKDLPEVRASRAEFDRY